GVGSFVRRAVAREDGVYDGEIPVTDEERTALTVVPTLRARRRTGRDAVGRRGFSVHERDVLQREPVVAELPVVAPEAHDAHAVLAVERHEPATVDDGVLVPGDVQ